MKELRTIKEDDDELQPGEETFGVWEIERFEKDLKKRVAELPTWSNADHVHKKGTELALLMRETARWHCEQYAEGVKEYDRLNKSKSLARSEKHVNATKELFGNVLNGWDEIKWTLCEAYKVVEKSPFEDTLLEEFERLTQELHKIRDTRYHTFQSDQMHDLLRSYTLGTMSARWCKKMTFWE